MQRTIFKQLRKRAAAGIAAAALMLSGAVGAWAQDPTVTFIQKVDNTESTVGGTIAAFSGTGDDYTSSVSSESSVEMGDSVKFVIDPITNGYEIEKWTLNGNDLTWGMLLNVAPKGDDDEKYDGTLDNTDNLFKGSWWVYAAIQNDIEVSANLVLKKYNVTVYSHAGSYDNCDPASSAENCGTLWNETVDHGTNLNEFEDFVTFKEDLKRLGYVLDNNEPWFVVGGTSAADISPIEGNLEIYPNWVFAPVVINNLGNGGTALTTVTYGSSFPGSSLTATLGGTSGHPADAINWEMAAGENTVDGYENDKPAGLDIIPNTGVIYWTGNLKAGKFNVKITAYNVADTDNYTFNTKEFQINIEPKKITVASEDIPTTVYRKDYDGDTTIGDALEDLNGKIDLSVASGLVGSDDVELIWGSAVFDTPNVLTVSKITLSDLSLGGANEKNYTLEGSTEIELYGAIDPIDIEFSTSPTAVDRVYDGTNVVALEGGELDKSMVVSVDLESGDIDVNKLHFTLGTGTMVDRHITTSTPKAVTTNITLTGTSAGNYTLAQPTDITVNIQHREITFENVVAADREYDGTDVVTIESWDFVSGSIADIDAGKITATLTATADKNVGSDKSVTVAVTLFTSDEDYPLTNYTKQEPSDVTVNITPKMLTLTGLKAKNRPFNAKDVVELDFSDIVFDGVIGSEDVHLDSNSITATIENGNVDTDKTVTIENVGLKGGDIDNYGIESTYQGVKVTITPLAVTVTPEDNQYKEYGKSDTIIYVAVPDVFDFSDSDLENAWLDEKVVLTRVAGENAMYYDVNNVAVQKSYAINGYTSVVTPSGNFDVKVAKDTDDPPKWYEYEIHQVDVPSNPTEQTWQVRYNDQSVQTVGIWSGLVSNSFSGLLTPEQVAGKDNVKYEVVGTTDANNILAGSADAPKGVTGGIQFKLAAALQNDDVDKAKTATIKVKVSNMLNYKDTIVFVKITIGEKSNANIVISKPVNVEYSGSPIGVTASTTSSAVDFDDPPWTYSYEGVAPTEYSASPTPPTLPGTYKATATINSSTHVGSVSDIYTINPKQLAWNSGAVAAKVYDRLTTVPDTNVTQPTLAGIVGADVVTVAKGTLVYTSAAAGTNSVTPSDYSIGGTHASRYVAPAVQPSFTVAPISKKVVTVSGITVANRDYNGSTTVALVGVPASPTGVIAPDNVTITGNTGTVGSAYTGSEQQVSTSLALGGTDKDNYELTQPTYVKATITKRMLTITAGSVTAVNRPYNGGVKVGLTGGTIVAGEIVGDDVVSLKLDSGTVAAAGAGDAKAVTTNITLTGDAAEKYGLTNGVFPDVTVNISKNALSITGVNVPTELVYNGATPPAITLTGGTLVGVVGGEVVGFEPLTGSIANGNAGTGRTVKVNAPVLTGESAVLANYTVNTPSELTVDIAKKPITITGITGVNRAYDGTNILSLDTLASTEDTVYGLQGVIAGDEVGVALTDAKGEAPDANRTDEVRTITNITGITLTGAAKDNYSLTMPTDVTGRILRAPITITGVKTGPNGSGTRPYNATTAVTLSGGKLAGLLDADTGKVGFVLGSGEVATPDVGAAKAVTTNITLAEGTGENADEAVKNYRIVQPTGLTLSITPKPITISGVTAVDRDYAADDYSVTLTGDATLMGVHDYDLDSVGYELGTGTLDTNTVGTWPVVTAIELTGSQKGNYSLTQPNITVNINAIVIPSYTANVNGGSGGGTFEAGDTVWISANVPNGKVFANWTTSSQGVTFANANSANTYFIMPARTVTVVANFDDEVIPPPPPPVKYTLTVASVGLGFEGNGEYEAGQRVLISCGLPPEGQRFARWFSNDMEISLANREIGKIFIDMPDRDVALTAEFEAISAPKVDFQFSVGANLVNKASLGKAAFFVNDNGASKSAAKLNVTGTIVIYDALGNAVRKLNVKSSDRKVAEWDLRDSKGKLVADGTYLAKGVLSVNGKKQKVSAMIGVN